MSAQTLGSLLWILAWGALFFWMMRAGCGAHIGGQGHGGHSRESPGPEGKVKDPVCGMDVDPQNAKAASVYRGTTYYFCSTSCRDKFEKDPAKYASAGGAPEAEHGGHHHA